jgi:hypothetical protein
MALVALFRDELASSTDVTDQPWTVGVYEAFPVPFIPENVGVTVLDYQHQ